MEFHGIPIPRWEVPWNSLKLRKFHGRWSNTKFHGTLGPQNRLSPSSIEFHEIPWNSGAAKCNITQFHGIPWNFESHFNQNHVIPDFYGIYHGIPWNSIEWPNKKSPSSMGFHGIKRAPLQMTQVFHGIPWNIPWNSMELWCRQMTYHFVPWNSMEHSMEFHGTLVPPNDISLSSMEFYGTFHGIPWKSGAAKWYITHFHGISCNFDIAILWHFTLARLPSDIQWNSRELWSHQIKNHRVPWDSMELRGHHFKWHKYSMEFHGIFHGIPWNSGAAKWHIT